MEGNQYLVDVGKRTPAIVVADSIFEAAFFATVNMPNAHPKTIVVRDLAGKTTKVEVAHRKCRKCGCSEERACPGGCCWMAWDLCSNCVE